MTKPLTDEDKQYLADRGMTVEELAERQATAASRRRESEPPRLFGQVPDEVLRAAVAQMRSQSPAAENTRRQPHRQELTEDAVGS